jgi:3-hydroxybutyryl-CoA dehydrogenase
MTKPLIGALGAGRMGRGIALVFAYAGHRCTLIDIKPRDAVALETLRSEAFAAIDGNLQALEAAQVLDAAQRAAILARIAFAGRDAAPGRAAAPAARAATDVLFEGVPERLDAKREAFAFANQHLRADAIIASTTSTILSNDLAPFVTRPERFLNAHWLNPAFIIPLVELSPADATAPEIVAHMKALLEGIGKVPVVCKPSPGFIVPRIQTLAMNEAARLVEEGVASVEDIDKATRYGLGFRFAVLGVLEFIDWGGGDILYYASRYLAQTTGQDRYAAPAIIDRNMRDGKLGLGSGQGFYDFDGLDRDAYQRERLGRLVSLLRHLDLLRPPV